MSGTASGTGHSLNSQVAPWHDGVMYKADVIRVRGDKVDVRWIPHGTGERYGIPRAKVHRDDVASDRERHVRPAEDGSGSDSGLFFDPRAAARAAPSEPEETPSPAKRPRLGPVKSRVAGSRRLPPDARRGR